MVINSKPLKMISPHKAAVLAEHLESERSKQDGKKRNSSLRSSSKASLKLMKKNQRTDRSQSNINEEQLPSFDNR